MTSILIPQKVNSNYWESKKDNEPYNEESNAYWVFSSGDLCEKPKQIVTEPSNHNGSKIINNEDSLDERFYGHKSGCDEREHLYLDCK